jgi:hypothetical protein
MAKDPAFLFYSQDFFTGTATMSFEDKGKYIHLLCLMHQQGRLKEETIRFLVGSVSDNLKNKFSVDEDGFWFNKRLEDESEKRNKFTESRRANGSLGGRPKIKEANLVVNHMDNHMANENEDSNIEIRKENFKQKLKAKFPSENINRLKAFFLYWSEHNDGGKKMRFEKETVFDLSRRMGTWKKNEKPNEYETEKSRIPRIK